METRLKLVFQNQILRSAFKAGIFGLLLFLAGTAAFKTTAVLIFLAAAFFLYLKPLFRTVEFILPFLLIIAFSFVAIFVLGESRYYPPAVILLSLLFFLMLGLKDLILIQRSAWSRFLNLSLAYLFFLLFFYYLQDFFVLKLGMLFLVTFFLARDLLKNKIFYWLTAFLIAESAWVIGLLPIGFISAATLLLLVYAVLTDLSLSHIEGASSRRRILTDVSIFVLLFILILAFSRWA